MGKDFSKQGVPCKTLSNLNSWHTVLNTHLLNKSTTEWMNEMRWDEWNRILTIWLFAYDKS